MLSCSENIAPDAGVDLLAAAAEEFHALARSLDGAGLPAIGLHLYGAAAALDRVLPQQQGWWSNAFNGQEGRSYLFLRMIDALRPAALVETGTFRGTTTAFMAEHFAGPIYTCEVEPRYYLTAKVTLARFPQVDVRNQDSRDFLQAVLPQIEGGPVVFYLDAHWQQDLPLFGELELILSRGQPAVVMIDDFAVPSDPQYHFDDYGPTKALTLELLARMNPKGASLFFPTLPSENETGERRGCAVLGIGDAVASLAGFAELRQHDWPTGGAAAGPAEPTPPRLPDMTLLRRLVTAGSLEAQRDALRNRAEVAEQERDALRQHTEVTEKERDVLRGRAEAAEHERDGLRQRAEVAEAERDALEGKVGALFAPNSWRVAAPLRSVRHLFGR